MTFFRNRLARLSTGVLIVSIVLAGGTSAARGATSPFGDIAGNTHEPAIDELYALGVTRGCSPSAYCPEEPVTRGQMAAFLNRALDLPAASTPSGFVDTAGTFADDIERLAAAGITRGCAPSAYCTDAPVTRGQMAAFLNRALELPAATTPSGFVDTAGTFADDIERLAAAGITRGCASWAYCTDRAVTRAEMASFLTRALDRFSTATGGPGREGTVNVFVNAKKPYNTWTSGGNWPWLNRTFTSMVVYEPYWDSRLASFDDVFVYQNSTGIKVDEDKDPRSTEHPEWIWREADGTPTYVDYGCNDGCARYSANIGNPDFRDDFVAEVGDLVDRGYTGLMLDDVNLLWRISDVNGDWVVPIDPQTGEPLTLENLQRYTAEFVELIREEFPDLRIMHNVIWFADATPGSDNPYVDRVLAAADMIQLERGANDPGLVGGDGRFSMQRFFEYVDRAHRHGTNVALLDTHAESEAEQWYNLAAALLVNDGGDLVSTEEWHLLTPEGYWSGFDTSLGAATGDRTYADGLFRRSFSDGLVLLRDPGASPVTVPLGEPMRRADTGATVDSVTLGARQAVVLHDLG